MREITSHKVNPANDRLTILVTDEPGAGGANHRTGRGFQMRCYVFDIDGTLSDPAHRLHHIEGETKDWPAFFEACDKDAPIPHMVDLAFNVAGDDAILFCTGRSDDVRDKTVAWLTKHLGFAIGPEDVYMRKTGDHRADTIVKSELMDQIIADGYEPIMVFEDRASVVTMWRERGIPCLQVVAGDY